MLRGTDTRWIVIDNSTDYWIRFVYSTEWNHHWRTGYRPDVRVLPKGLTVFNITSRVWPADPDAPALARRWGVWQAMRHCGPLGQGLVRAAGTQSDKGGPRGRRVLPTTGNPPPTAGGYWPKFVG